MSYQSKYTGSQLEYVLDNAMLRSEAQEVPKKLSELENDTNFVDSETVDSKIEAAVNEMPGADLSDYVKHEELNSKVEEVVGEAIENINIPDATYQSNIEDKNLEMPNKLGGIEKGTTVSELEGKSYNALFDDLLFPTVYPTFVSPSATIKFNGYASIQEVGAVAPTENNFSTSFNRGAINLNGEKQADRAGIMTSGEVYCVSGTMPSTVALGNILYKYRAYYAQGPQPKDNKGNNYSTPLASGYVDSSAITLNGTRPWYIGTAKLSLVAWSDNMSTGNFTLAATGIAPQVFKLPKSLKELQMLNAISGKMEVISTTEWSTTNESINGTTYYVYTYTGAARGEVTLLAKF